MRWGHLLVLRMANTAADFGGSYCSPESFPTQLFEAGALPSGTDAAKHPVFSKVSRPYTYSTYLLYSLSLLYLLLLTLLTLLSLLTLLTILTIRWLLKGAPPGGHRRLSRRSSAGAAAVQRRGHLHLQAR